VFVAAMVCTGLAPACAAPSTEAIVRRYVAAQGSLNIRGKVLTVHPTPSAVRTTSRRVVKRADGRSLSVFEAPTSQKGVILADDGAWTRKYDPSERVVRKKRALELHGGSSDTKLARLILRNYRVQHEGLEAVAGRQCHRLRFQPRTERNLTVRIWTDKANGAELRRDELDGSGSTICIVMYTSVSFPSRIPLSEVTPRFPRGARVECVSRSGVRQSVADLSKAAGFQVRAPLLMPSGFTFVAGAAASIAGRTSVFLRYTDGLSDLTIIEAPAQRRSGLPSRSARVLPRPYGEVEVDYALDGLQVVILGRGNARELVEAAEALDPRREKAWRSEVGRTFNGASHAVTAMRNRGLTGDTVVALLTLSSHTGKAADVVMRSYLDGWCWRDLARRWRVPEATIDRAVQALSMRE